MSSAPPPKPETMAIERCAFHEIEARVGQRIDPIDAIILGTVLGFRSSASGAAPKMCSECLKRFEECCRHNGITLAWMSKAESDAVAKATGSRFIPMDEPKKGNA